MNQRSSRSHTILIIEVEQTMSDRSGKKAQLNLVDLAGSEKVKKTMATGNTLEEAKKINLSLSALSNCIFALAKKQAGGGNMHVPYRDSKLTRLLQESLGGNSKTTLIVTCSESPIHIEETISSLRFASRAKCIKNEVHANVHLSVELLQEQVNNLKQALGEANLRYEQLAAGTIPLAPPPSVETVEHQLLIQRLEMENRTLTEEVAELRAALHKAETDTIMPPSLSTSFSRSFSEIDGIESRSQREVFSGDGTTDMAHRCEQLEYQLGIFRGRVVQLQAELEDQRQIAQQSAQKCMRLALDLKTLRSDPKTSSTLRRQPIKRDDPLLAMEKELNFWKRKAAELELQLERSSGSDGSQDADEERQIREWELNNQHTPEIVTLKVSPQPKADQLLVPNVFDDIAPLPLPKRRVSQTVQMTPRTMTRIRRTVSSTQINPLAPSPILLMANEEREKLGLARCKTLSFSHAEGGGDVIAIKYDLSDSESDKG
eukprot:c19645_g1_i3.p1 GENE.c19645_g1_i3~~c19645_g1_i3.p1  ORF type:complete len:488 (-),score=79.90 c19645_g1_i3:98-1561(-)